MPQEFHLVPANLTLQWISVCSVPHRRVRDSTDEGGFDAQDAPQAAHVHIFQVGEVRWEDGKDVKAPDAFADYKGVVSFEFCLLRQGGLPDRTVLLHCS